MRGGEGPLYNALLEDAQSTWRIDTHIHIPGRPFELPGDWDVLMEYTMTNFSCDLVSAGLHKSVLRDVVWRAGVPLDQKWALLAPYWAASRNTTYCQMLDRSAKRYMVCHASTARPLGRWMQRSGLDGGRAAIAARWIAAAYGWLFWIMAVWTATAPCFARCSRSARCCGRNKGII